MGQPKRKKIFDTDLLEALPTGTAIGSNDLVVFTINKPGQASDIQYVAKFSDIINAIDNIAEHITDTTQSTSTSTGALIVDGGVGIVKDVFIGGALNIVGTITVPSITEKTAGAGITFSKNIIKQNTATAINSTGTATAAIINKGLITSTSGAATTITLDTAVNIAAQIGAVQGTVIEFIVDNTAGSNTVTVAVAVGIVAAKQVSAGDTASDILLTVAASATVGIGIFRLVFSSATAAVLYRVG